MDHVSSNKNKSEIIMKVLFRNLIGGYTGKADNMILYYDRRLNKVIIRQAPEVKLTDKHEAFGNVSKNLRKINPSNGYKDDFKTYTDLYSRLRANYNHPVSNWYNLYLKMMYGMTKANPLIDLKTISREQIETENLPCRTVKQAIEAGLLPPVRNYHNLISEI
jgi:hypothetical protein